MAVRHVMVVTESKAVFLPRIDPKTLRHGRPGRGDSAQSWMPLNASIEHIRVETLRQKHPGV